MVELIKGSPYPITNISTLPCFVTNKIGQGLALTVPRLDPLLYNLMTRRQPDDIYLDN